MSDLLGKPALNIPLLVDIRFSKKVAQLNASCFDLVNINNLNIIMKILTSVTLVISVPTLIASFWGMNTGVPLEGKPWGFWVVLAISVAISAILALFLHKKKLL